MTFGNVILAIVVIFVVIFVIVTIFRAIKIVPQATAGIVERLGKYHKTLTPGLNVPQLQAYTTWLNEAIRTRDFLKSIGIAVDTKYGTA